MSKQNYKAKANPKTSGFRQEWQKARDPNRCDITALESWLYKSALHAPKRPLSTVLQECWAAYHVLEHNCKGLDRNSFAIGFLTAEGYRTVDAQDDVPFTAEGAKRLLDAIFGEKDGDEDE